VRWGIPWDHIVMQQSDQREFAIKASKVQVDLAGTLSICGVQLFKDSEAIVNKGFTDR
jgi:hypothetical protein